ncbi:ninjurin-2-like isoform X5 [Cottoperca gobio]|uniref:Ninjurin-2-like isoform X5 n=1 Tax=Cottoperca gobio TaxID=56716 RepID=A0A6J2S430_COTGO|nr:ninjurin-2-like isoform X5 [Cottoperca gobio]
MQGLGKTERGEQGRDIDLTSLRSTMPASGPLQGGSPSNLNMNLYATKKTAAEGMLDIALFLANITHMKTVIEQGAGYRYYAAVLTLISFSLALQIVAGVLIIIIAVVKLPQQSDHWNHLPHPHRQHHKSRLRHTAQLLPAMAVSAFHSMKQ